MMQKYCVYTKIDANLWIFYKMFTNFFRTIIPHIFKNILYN